jgi:hypothetical protein
VAERVPSACRIRERERTPYPKGSVRSVASLVPAALVLLVIAGSCGDSSTGLQPQTATYRLTFESTWSAATHPADFPPNPHFSGLIGAVHATEARLWEEGELASPGIKNMAERGFKEPLGAEVDTLIAHSEACSELSGGGINPSPGTVELVFTVDLDCPAVSVVSMIAPSPDWFVGVSGLLLFEDGAWVDGKVVELFPFDAGTDSGLSYLSPDQATNPPEPIQRIETDPFLIGLDVPPLGTVTFTRL